MGKKITQYTAVTNTNPDTGSLLDISEKSGSAYTTKKWSLLQLKTWLTTYLTIPFSSVTSTPTTISGYGITDAVDTTGGTANYVSKFTDANTIEESQIQDDGTSISVNTSLDANVKLKVVSSQKYAIYTTQSATSGYNYASRNISGGLGADVNVGCSGESSGATQQNTGSYGRADGNATTNMGVYGVSEGAGSNYGVAGSSTGTTGTNIGLSGTALNGTLNYAVQLADGTEGIGKILKSVTNNGEANWEYFPCEVQLAVSDETTALTTGTGKITFRMPYAMVLQEVRASLVVAGTTSGLTTIDINEGGVSILSTKLTIDLTEKTSTTATTPAVISDTALSDDAEITIDIDAISGGATEKGLKVLLKGYRLL